jgi:hypothetical protein
MATKARKKYKQKPTVRLSESNIEVLKMVRDCLELKHEKDMIELNIKDLSINDALTYILIVFSRRHMAVLDKLDMTGKAFEMFRYAGSV